MAHDAVGSKKLGDRLAELEAQDAALKDGPTATRGGSKLNTVAAVILIALGALLAPIATVGAWARVELIDTDRFVATFAPLAKDPAIQDLVVNETVAAIYAQVDIDAKIDEAFSGFEQLDLPAGSKALLMSLSGPAADGVRSLIESNVRKMVESDQFADLWAQSLRVTHTQALATLKGDPNAVAQVGPDGAVSIQLEPIIEAAKQRLADEGISFVANLPTTAPTIVLMQADSLVLMQAVYTIAVAAGHWMPWITLGLLAGGVVVARRRMRALAWAGIAVAFMFLLAALGFGTGRIFFIAKLSPEVMPADAAAALYQLITQDMLSTTKALIVFGLIVAVGGWLAGQSRRASAFRSVFNGGTAALRRFGDEHGISTGKVGEQFDRFRIAAHSAIAVLAVLVLMATRPVSTDLLFTTVIVMVVAMLAVELVRRPAQETVPGS